MYKTDILSNNITLKIANNERYQTNLGGFLTILLGFLVMLSIFTFGKDIILKEEPISILSENIVKDPIVKSSDLFLTLNVAGNGGSRIPDTKRIFTPYIIYIDNDSSDPSRGDIPAVISKHSMIPCLENQKFLNNTFKARDNIKVNQDLFFCFENDFNLDLLGSYGDSVFKTVRIVLDKCKNTTDINGNENNDCESSEIQEQRMGKEAAFVKIDIFSNYIDIVDYENPIKPIWWSRIWRLSYYLGRVDLVNFKTVDFVNDEGLFFKSGKSTETFIIDSSSYEAQTNVSYYANFNLSVMTIKELHSRSYLKFQKIAADSGGIIKFLHVVFAFVACLYGRVSLLDYLILHVLSGSKQYSDNNNLFNFDKNSTVGVKKKMSSVKNLFNYKNNLKEIKETKESKRNVRNVTNEKDKDINVSGNNVSNQNLIKDTNLNLKTQETNSNKILDNSNNNKRKYNNFFSSNNLLKKINEKDSPASLNTINYAKEYNKNNHKKNSNVLLETLYFIFSTKKNIKTELLVKTEIYLNQILSIENLMNLYESSSMIATKNMNEEVGTDYYRSKLVDSIYNKIYFENDILLCKKTK